MSNSVILVLLHGKAWLAITIGMVLKRIFSLKMYLLRDSSNQAMGLHEPSRGLTTITFTAVGQQGACEKCATLKTIEEERQRFVK